MEPDLLDRELGPRLWWRPAVPPARTPLAGARVRLEPLDAVAHAAALFEAAQGEGSDPRLWLYLADGPFADEAAFTDWVRTRSASVDPLFFAIAPNGEPPSGMAALMRCDAANGVIEIGHVWFGPTLQRTAAATEAIYLLARHALDDLGFRRLEWKCHARNLRSRRAAERFGFTHEGTFRNAVVHRDRNRDTAWYSIIDTEWPRVREAVELWLAPGNFDDQGRQRRRLAAIRADLFAAQI